MKTRFLIFLNILLSVSLWSQSAPAFKVTTTDSTEIKLYESYLLEGKAVVLELFFVACPPCNRFAPHLGELYEELQEKNVPVEFISLSTRSSDNDENVHGFKEKYMHDWPFVSPDGGSLEVIAEYESTYAPFPGTPYLIVIAPDGTVNYEIRGSIGVDLADNLEAAIIDALTVINYGDSTASISGTVATYSGKPVAGTSITLNGDSDLAILTDSSGNFRFNSLTTGIPYELTATKEDEAAAGVTTLDMVLTSRHILGIDTFTNIYQHLAADVNRSGSITTFDMVQMRQVILGIIDEFPGGRAWAFQPDFERAIVLESDTTWSFVAFKYGDVNESAVSFNSETSEARSTNSILVKTPQQSWSAGEKIQVPLSIPASQLAAIQFTVEYDADNLVWNESATNAASNSLYFYQKQAGTIGVLWTAEENPTDAIELELWFDAQKPGNIKNTLQIGSRQTPKLAYDQQGKLQDVALQLTTPLAPKSEQWQLQTNLFFDNINLQLQKTMPKPASVQMEIVDVQGRIHWQQQQVVNKGVQNLQLDAGDFDAGVYFLNIRTAGIAGFQTHKLVVR